MQKFLSLFTLYTQLKTYKWTFLKKDFLSGFLISIILIPQAMALAIIANLPPEIGLYASLLPLLVYSFIGGSKYLSVGPTSIVALMTLHALSWFEFPPERLLAYAGGLALITGFLYVLFAVFKLKFIDYIISHSVLKGFCIAAGLIIIFMQIGPLLGIKDLGSHNFLKSVLVLCEKLEFTHMPSLVIGVSSLGFLILLKVIRKGLIGGILLVIIGTILSKYMDFQSMGVEVLGHIPEKLPHFIIPRPFVEDRPLFLEACLGIVLVGFLESYSIAKSFAIQEKSQLNVRRELLAIGLANMGTSFFQGFPVAGSFSRSALKFQIQVHSNLVSLFAAFFVGFFVLFFSSSLYYLPKTCLSALIIMMLVKLVDIKSIIETFKIKKVDGLVLLFTCLVTLCSHVTFGVLSGIVFSFIVMVYQFIKDNVIQLGRKPGCEDLVPIEKHPDAKHIKGIGLFAVESPLYFINIQRLELEIFEYVDSYRDVHTVIIDGSRMMDIDMTAVEGLHQIELVLKKRNCELYIVKGSRNPELEETLARINWKGPILETTADAIAKAKLKMFPPPISR
jgi:SulP family sulfate permease